MKKFLIVLIVIIIAVIGLNFLYPAPAPTDGAPADTAEEAADKAAADAKKAEEAKAETSIGKSVGGKDIMAYNYGTGATKVVFVGGIHGGYSWNTVTLAYELMDYLKANPAAIPANITVSVIPVLNPDGLMKVTGSAGRFAIADVNSSATVQASGRFNGNTVDINRNFDCDWQANGTWQSKAVSGGESAFSEPEAAAFKAYVEAQKPSAVVVFDSSAGGVFASNCHGGVPAVTSALTAAYAKASGYKAYESFDFYTITGDVVNWLAKINVPAISVLLSTHTDSEWTKNKAGVEAVLSYFKK